MGVPLISTVQAKDMSAPPTVINAYRWPKRKTRLGYLKG